MKKLILVALVLFLSVAPHVLAQGGFVPLAPIPGLTDQSSTSAVDQNTLANFFNNLYKYLVGLAAVLAVIEIIWGGLQISTQDSVSKQGEGRERITQALLGLLLVLSPVIVFSIINPSILNLSLNLPEIKNAPVVSGGAGGGGAVDTASGCSVVGDLLQRATCPSTETAQTFASNCTGGYGAVLPYTVLPASQTQQSCQIVSGAQVCTTPGVAICEKTLAGTFVTVNLGTFLSPRLQPVGSNASDYTNFKTSCAQSQGIFCGSKPLSSVTCPSTLNVNLQPGQSGSCYDVSSIYCGDRVYMCSDHGGTALQ